MMHYRAYPIAPDGKVLVPKHVHAESDEQAIEEVKKIIGSHPMEIWEGARSIAKITPNKENLWASKKESLEAK